MKYVPKPVLPRLLIPDEKQNNNDENTFKTLVLNKYKHYKRDYNTKDTKLSKFFAYKTRKSHKTRQQQLSGIFPKKPVKPVIFLTTRKACVYNSRVLNIPPPHTVKSSVNNKKATFVYITVL